MTENIKKPLPNEQPDFSKGIYLLAETFSKIQIQNYGDIKKLRVRRIKNTPLIGTYQCRYNGYLIQSSHHYSEIKGHRYSCKIHDSEGKLVCSYNDKGHYSSPPSQLNVAMSHLFSRRRIVLEEAFGPGTHTRAIIAMNRQNRKDDSLVCKILGGVSQ